VPYIEKYGFAYSIYLAIYHMKRIIDYSKHFNQAFLNESDQGVTYLEHSKFDFEHTDIISRLRSEGFAVHSTPPRTIKSNFGIYKLTDPKLIGLQGIPYLSNKFPKWIYQDKQTAMNQTKNQYSSSPFTFRGNHLRNGQKVSGCSVVISAHGNYFHFITEQLTKLCYASYIYDDFKVIFQRPFRNFHRELIDLIDYRKIPLHDGIRPEELLITDFPWMEPHGLKFVREYFMSNVEEVQVSKSDYIFIQRSRSRKILNMAEIKEALEQTNLNIRYLDFSETTQAEEINLVHQATGIIGVHGAGLTSMIWGSNLDILEIFPGEKLSVYPFLSKSLGHNYSFVGGARVEEHDFDSDIYVNPHDLVSELS